MYCFSQIFGKNLYTFASIPNYNFVYYSQIYEKIYKTRRKRKKTFIHVSSSRKTRIVVNLDDLSEKLPIDYFDSLDKFENENAIRKIYIWRKYKIHVERQAFIT